MQFLAIKMIYETADKTNSDSISPLWQPREESTINSSQKSQVANCQIFGIILGARRRAALAGKRYTNIISKLITRKVSLESIFLLWH